MSQCLHCGRPCAECDVFCETCLARSENTVQLEEETLPPIHALATASAFCATGEHAWKQQGPGTTSDKAVESPTPEDEISQGATLPLSAPPHIEANALDQAVSRLSAAARQIKMGKAGEKRLRRSSRLAPLHDISTEIQRASTPHPRLERRSSFDTQPEAERVSDPHATDFWPWFINEESEEEKESDLWANATDPLISRARPTTATSAHIEEEDIQRVQAEVRTTLPPTARRRLSLWHLAFISLVIIALAALLIDGLLLFTAFNHTHRAPRAQAGPPTLTLSANIANTGDEVSIQLTHFVPGTTVALTRDIQQTLLTTSQSSSLSVNVDGQATVSFTVGRSWEAGFHLIVAEDVTTRDTASAMLQIGNAGPSRPPHLLLAASSLDLGSAVQGADTIQPLILRNTGSGSITWFASSNQPWLLVAPQQGTFSAGQNISLAAQRSHLLPGNYYGTLTISSSVSAPIELQVTMTVTPLPPDAGPTISLTPPLLSFTTVDGSTTPITQALTLSNPGQQTLYWSLTDGKAVTATAQDTFLHLPGSHASPHRLESPPDPGGTPWLSTDVTTGSLPPGQSRLVHLTVRSQNLLPGAYMSMLTFGAARNTRAYDAPQMVGVALTVQPHCGLLTSSGNLSFTAVSGQSNPSTQTLNLSATTSCSGSALSWQARSSANWLTVSPASGQIAGPNSSITAIGVNTANLVPGRYTGVVTFQTTKSTSTVTVQLNLQQRPAPSEPIMGVSPLSLNFSTIQGQASPAGQVLTITNNGGSPLKWRTSITMLNSGWISIAPASGTVPPGQTGQATVNLTTTNLTPGNYSGLVTILGNDTRNAPASGNPQTITVSLSVQPLCSLAQPSAGALLFNGIANSTNPVAQSVTLTGAGSCSWPLHWSASATSSAPWLTLTPTSGTLASASEQGMLTVNVNTRGLQPGTYSTSVKISASDTVGIQAQGSPQFFSVTLTVLQPCTLQPLPSGLVFNASQGAASPSAQTITLSSTGSCGGGVTWTASPNAGSSSWLSLSANAGTDSGGGSSITVNPSPGSLTPNTYTGQITISASNQGVVLQGSPQTINVTFIISGYSVSGSIVACAGPAPTCNTAQSLPDASVSLVNGSGSTIATITADASGNFTFTNIPLGTYTLNASGISGGTPYSGTGSVTVNGTTAGINIQTF